MSKTTSFNLGDHFNQFISTQPQNGRYRSASEIIRASLRLLEQEEQKVEALRLALIDGENSGADIPYNMNDIIREAKTEAGLDV